MPAGPGQSGREIAFDSGYSWFRLGLSILLTTLGGVGMWSVVVVLPMVQTEFAVARGAASFPYTLTMAGFALGGVMMGRLIDRFGIVRPVIGGTILFGTGYVLSGLAPNLWVFALCQGFMIGVGSSATFGPLLADVSMFFRARRGLAVALCASGNYVAGTIWPGVVQHFMTTAGWRATQIGIGLFCIVAMVPLALLLKPRPPSQIGAAGSVSAEGRLSALGLSPATLQWLLAAAGISCCVAMSMPQVHIVAYCVDLGYGVARGAEMLSLMLGLGIVSRIASGFVADRIGGVATLMIGSVMQAVALVLYVFSDGLTSLYVVSGVFGLFQGGIVPSYAIIVREYFPAREAGARVGVVLMATLVGMAFGGWLSGAIYDWTGSYAAAFLNGIAWNLVNIAVCAWLLLRGRRRPQAVPA
ncbi:MFS transporter [Prosthecomicrobium hirschii]|uniref:MFS transporter n=1 Tax=Prosthecodimorpha hirschii TaxID=665126 RepID=UPI00112B6DB8|nr:MFS transporter [Prosthecomicrobium hirschii]TPQ46714.1 MFS transporter [Prosthecomicrobium hirschii]